MATPDSLCKRLDKAIARIDRVTENGITDQTIADIGRSRLLAHIKVWCDGDVPHEQRQEAYEHMLAEINSSVDEETRQAEKRFVRRYPIVGAREALLERLENSIRPTTWQGDPGEHFPDSSGDHR